MPRRGSTRHDPAGEGLLSIGALSTAAGIPIDTIRTWERRYGFPVPERKPSGQRVYPLGTVSRLRRAAQAIARGHRAAEVIPASESALEALLDSLPPARGEPAPPIPTPNPAAGPSTSGVASALDAVRGYDTERLRQRLQADWALLGPLDFLEQAGVLLRAVGDAWASGDLEVRHEHFASGVLGDFLRSVRAPLDERATGPIVALATLPDELHGLGLQMAALVVALAGWRPLVLGVDTPVSQISGLAREVPLGAAALSCIRPITRRDTAAIRALRRQLPRAVSIVLGGQSAPGETRLKGVEIVKDLRELDRWARAGRV
jgi:MerR family transcriptional regulator, light-induced transcriptional regulator